jgi:hypothetical protein
MRPPGFCEKFCGIFASRRFRDKKSLRLELNATAGIQKKPSGFLHPGGYMKRIPHGVIFMRPPGFEPGSPDWQSGVIATRLRSRFVVFFVDCDFMIIFVLSRPQPKIAPSPALEGCWSRMPLDYGRGYWMWICYTQWYLIILFSAGYLLFLSRLRGSRKLFLV